MRKIREVLRLRHEQGLSHQAVAQACAVGVGTVNHYLQRAAQSGLSWPLPDELDDAALDGRLFRRPAPVSNRARPECAYIHRELKRDGVTLQLLWEEYLQVHPDGPRRLDARAAARQRAARPDRGDRGPRRARLDPDRQPVAGGPTGTPSSATRHRRSVPGDRPHAAARRRARLHDAAGERRPDPPSAARRGPGTGPYGTTPSRSTTGTRWTRRGPAGDLALRLRPGRPHPWSRRGCLPSSSSTTGSIWASGRSTSRGRIPDFPVTRSHPPASWPSAANSSICRTYRKTAGEESRRRSPVANRWMRP